MKNLIVVLVIVLAGVLYAAQHYYSKYDRQLEIHSGQITKIQQLTDTINYQNTHINMLHELDAKHMEKLANDKTEIDALRADVAAARRKLRIKAICPVREATPSGSVADAGDPQLTEAARQDYYRLREMMAENERQTKYLQDYIKTQCQ
ncbi:lysis protein [Xenorhabdus sp. M]|uniref:Lysis protein n=2 Tax=Xenorhabdus szentirmaii TaxID=290112 RepID=A0AAW3YWM4_9GAMM|nr:lysis protein [Xenorhabdus sp. M]